MEIKVDPYRAQQFERNAETREAGKAANAQGQAQTQATAAQADRVSLSPEARLQAAAMQAASNAPDMRADKVAELKAKVESGEYRPDSRNIAAKLLQEEAEIFAE